MARQLWLLRHADAEPHGTREDSERRLTERGERQARLAGEAIALMGVELEALLSSPKERALRTATVAAQAWSEKQRAKVEIHAPLAEGFDARQALAVMSALPSRPRAAGEAALPARALLVGHEPDLSTVVAELTGARIDLKKGGLAVVRIEGASGELMVLLRPSELALIAKSRIAASAPAP
ncbi:MAG TPA: histidine phosphatase family protein [Solirubrobacteraceae bacterium]|jgi:phosphohistidine phosphatase|nr:histidine phosphatase family protein [Solirubrobacteraceae bacterium]